MTTNGGSSPAKLPTIVAVMKKFHGRRVPRPIMKKMIHTALYLETKKGRSQKLLDQDSRSPDGDPCTSNIWIPASALSCRQFHRLMYRNVCLTCPAVR